ncbi:hypothetical protein UFOVP181_173 [uncultured Caudovirales phage]|uniref:Uncharacterized protein n=1 Tax=uncultured Caudovirales phage TaxID=2100421 RepID=A0A6J5KXV0_9CAUD|nr:hypothetical protein UFOVP57_466 [uncultured Caudovirales phage]CAB5208784.1 hypothetical protein UFOVP181_173 [uncultured Caudovirales phage]
MERIKVAPAYNDEWLETERPQPLSDLKIEQLQQDVLNGKLDKDISDQVYDNFKQEMTAWLFKSKLNNLTGFDSFNRVDIVNGCTQYIDNLYMTCRPQNVPGDYRYHQRLGNWDTEPGKLQHCIPLVIAMPFPSTGAVHLQMKEILDECLEKNIPVHIDGAWVTCCRSIDFDFNHPAIWSLSISLSKGLGLGWNRIGLRWTRERRNDSITIMNDFNMNLRATAMIGLHFLRNLPPDYLWNTYGEQYYKVCKDFNLTPTNSIYLALRNGLPVGVSPLIRFLASN